MSSVYVSEPPTSGKVVLETTAGDLEIELWAKEAPKACRNFVQLCLEGYYDGTLFHRVVPGWIVQGGDPTGTGAGGESVYGAPFADEFHSRLRFGRRGMVGMASSGPNANGSQFFITLAATPELQNKNTLFAVVVGASLFNALRLAEGEVDKDTERPAHPARILRSRVLDNPFADIVPRARPQPAQAPAAPAAKKAVRDRKLLSFGDDDDDAVVGGAGMKSSHDLLASDPMLRRTQKQPQPQPQRPQRPQPTQDPLEPRHEKTTAATPEPAGHDAEAAKDIGHTKPTRLAPSKHKLRLGGAAAAKGPKRPRAGAAEDALLARLGAFRARIGSAKGARPDPAPGDDAGWLAHSLRSNDPSSPRDELPDAQGHDAAAAAA
ncbi:Peptidyl-prolyl isomerase cwc27 [Coemansia javaensis]|uniref:Peptidyl-prolyl isomerase CWC27 n=1 Tax=Coemansia javaensis TaxID=2761396 RepID=A0A9W8LJM6_9FUNG|nr:Peptidyl-prolyl isomerase cwc27 [Coemansia javaensis]